MPLAQLQSNPDFPSLSATVQQAEQVVAALSTASCATATAKKNRVHPKGQYPTGTSDIKRSKLTFNKTFEQRSSIRVLDSKKS